MPDALPTALELWRDGICVGVVLVDLRGVAYAREALEARYGHTGTIKEQRAHD